MMDFELNHQEFKLRIINTKADIGGAITTKEDIDRIKDFPSEENLMISGLNQ